MFGWFKKSKPVPDPWDVAIRDLDSMDMFVFLGVYRSIYSVETLSVVYPTIVEYTQALKKINHYFASERVLPASEYVLEPTIAAVSDFFTDGHGNYIQPRKAAEEWSNQVKEFISHIRKVNDSSIHIRNKNVTSRLAGNIINTISSLNNLANITDNFIV